MVAVAGLCFLAGVTAALAGEGEPTVIQCIKGGADGVPEITHLQAPWRVGEYLHVPANASDVLTFRIGGDGKLIWSHRETVKVEEGQRLKYLSKVMGDRACAVERVGGGYKGKRFVSASLAVYTFDSKTGKRKELGRAECPESSALTVSPDRKTAYLLPTAGGKLLRFSIDEVGAVRPAGEYAGEKFTGRSLEVSPDGKFLYWLRFTHDGQQGPRLPGKPNQVMIYIEIAAVGADGKVTHAETVEYRPPPQRIMFKGFFLSPDGGHAYLYAWDYKKGYNFGMIYSRDAASGKLALLDHQNDFKGKMYTLQFETPELGICRNWKFGERSAVTLFRRDVNTGQLADCGDIKGVTRIGWIAWVGHHYWRAKSTLYVTGIDMNQGLRGIYVVDLRSTHWVSKAGK
jgi:hypothetical protein